MTKKIKLIFLGSGSAFTVRGNNFQSNILLIDEQNHTLLIDCGSDVRFSLAEQGYDFKNITDIYISHLHADHVGGLEWLAFNSKYNNRGVEPNLYIAEDLVDDLWEHSLSGGLNAIEEEKVSLASFFKVFSVAKSSGFIWNGIHFQLVKTLHVKNNINYLPSYGVYFKCGKTNIFITTDTRFVPEYYTNYYQQADIIFHDCSIARQDPVVHAHFDELSTLNESIKQKMWLYHYEPGQLPDAQKHGFLGFVQKGQIFLFELD